MDMAKNFVRSLFFILGIVLIGNRWLVESLPANKEATLSPTDHVSINTTTNLNLTTVAPTTTTKTLTTVAMDDKTTANTSDTLTTLSDNPDKNNNVSVNVTVTSSEIENVSKPTTKITKKLEVTSPTVLVTKSSTKKTSGAASSPVADTGSKKISNISSDSITTLEQTSETENDNNTDYKTTSAKPQQSKTEDKTDVHILLVTDQTTQSITGKSPESGIDKSQPSGNKKSGAEKPAKSGTMIDEDDSGGHFMAYFITFVVICIAGYILYHNKQKILAFILEGRKEGGGRRRPKSKEYKRLKTDEIMPSLEKNTSDNKYIY